MRAVRVYLGSSMPEYYLYDADGRYLRYWGVYHDGPLPAGIALGRVK